MAAEPRNKPANPRQRPAVHAPAPDAAAAALEPLTPAVEPSTTGPVSAAVAADIARLTPRLDQPDASLMALALTLARALDDGAGMATAAVARELRATLAALTPEEHHDDDGFAALIDQLRAPMGDAATR